MNLAEWLWRWCWVNGVPGNLVATIICLAAGYFAGLRKHIRRTKEIHARMFGDPERRHHGRQ